MSRIGRVMISATIIVPLTLTAVSCTNSGDSTTSGSHAPSARHPKLPGSLPSANADDTPQQFEQVMRELIAVAAAHAVGVPESDRHPDVQVTDDFACGVKVKANVCAPTSTKDKLTIYINPTITRQQFQQGEGHGGGNTPLQNSVISTYASYTVFRDIQRNHPDLITGSSDAQLAQAKQLALCNNGKVSGPLKPAMSPELRKLFDALQSEPDYIKGTKGEC